jgi:hypothetical protein
MRSDGGRVEIDDRRGCCSCAFGVEEDGGAMATGGGVVDC